jgi:hypothetical protein
MKAVMYRDTSSPDYCDPSKTFQQLKRSGKLDRIRKKVCICDLLVLYLSSNLRFQFYEAVGSSKANVQFPRADWVVSEPVKQIHQHKRGYSRGMLFFIFVDISSL